MAFVLIGDDHHLIIPRNSSRESTIETDYARGNFSSPILPKATTRSDDGRRVNIK